MYICPMTIGKAIKKERKARRMTQQHLANLIGINVRSLREMEKERAMPSKKNLEKIAEVFGKEWEHRLV